ncbi:MAG TPA: peptidoglycan editing factor PgeF [Tepidisphaeraceae bacterium]|nr:peptidoglycan editing factor PgeF [Tepidisphaeraceae bacterium]
MGFYNLLAVLIRAQIGPVVVYQSPLLLNAGICHGFSTRLGGISPRPFDCMNLGNPNGCDVQDDTRRIEENYQRLSEAIGGKGREILRVHQVHGAAVAKVRRGKAFEVHQKADAMVSDDPTRFVSVRVADCVPVLLACEDGSLVAAIHAGWRGVIARVIPAALDVMNVERGRLIAAIGPCIGVEAFEVGPEVVAAFVESFGQEAPVRRREDGKGHVDLRRAIARQLLAEGVAADRIDLSERCTFRDREEFFSHRRDNGITGRMAALIAAAE